jgi:hypothetical protein
VRLSKDLMMNWKKKCLGLFKSTASSLSERRMGGEAEKGGEAGKSGEASFFLYWYITVFAFLVLQIVLYYFITQHFK